MDRRFNGRAVQGHRSTSGAAMPGNQGSLAGRGWIVTGQPGKGTSGQGYRATCGRTWCPSRLLLGGLVGTAACRDHADLHRVTSFLLCSERQTSSWGLMGNGKRREVLDGLGQRRSNPCLAKVASVQAHQERDSIGVGHHHRHHQHRSTAAAAAAAARRGAASWRRQVQGGVEENFGGVLKDLGSHIPSHPTCSNTGLPFAVYKNNPGRSLLPVMGSTASTFRKRVPLPASRVRELWGVDGSRP